MTNIGQMNIVSHKLVFPFVEDFSTEKMVCKLVEQKVSLTLKANTSGNITI